MNLIVIVVRIASFLKDGSTVHGANETTEPEDKMNVIGCAHVQAEQEGKMKRRSQTS